jgi:prepilin-type N-terminal cleavage/methylation domain-containing protein
MKFLWGKDGNSASRGFTLLEIMVSMAILAILIVILSTMVDSSAKLWRQSENRVDSFREARAALNLIASDMQSIAFPKESNPKQPRFFALNSGAELPGSASQSPEASSLFFLSALPTSEQQADENKSDLCTIGYFLAYDSPTLNQKDKSLNLYRFFRSSDKTDVVLRGQDPIAANFTTGPSGEEVLARNIVGFKIRGYIVDAITGTVTDYPDATGTPPSYLDIELTAVNNEAAHHLDSKAKLTDQGSSTYRREARTFTTRIDLSSARSQQ